MNALQGILSPGPMSASGVGRLPWLAPALYSLALLGVPAAVILGTGGPRTIAFWFEAILHLLVAFTLGAALFTAVALFVLAPVLWVVRRLFPAWSEAIGPYGIIGLILVGGSIYFLSESSLRSSAVELPTASANVGALIVMMSAGLLSWGLIRTGRLVKRANAVNPFGPTLTTNPVARIPWGYTPPEPEDEYWSNEAVEGWRAWAWNSRSLQGFRTEWNQDALDATCDICKDPPGWEHPCGIYGLKDPSLVSLFGDAPVVGRVEMWGDVIEHDLGYRASHARITDLWVDSPADAERIARAYPEARVWSGSPLQREGDLHGQHR